jgi:hypothetical protein
MTETTNNTTSSTTADEAVKQPKFTTRVKAKISGLLKIEAHEASSVTAVFSVILTFFSSLYYGISGIIYAVAALYAFLMTCMGLIPATILTVVVSIFAVPVAFRALLLVADVAAALVYNTVSWVSEKTSNLFSRGDKVTVTVAEAPAV